MKAAALLLALAAASARASEALFSPLSDELSRSVRRLRMEGLERPHYLSYLVRDGEVLEAAAAFGALQESRQNRARDLSVSLRVGSPALDNSNYVPRDFWAYRPAEEELASEDGYDALRAAAWTATDAAYKSALKRLSQKKAYRSARMIRDPLPDQSPAPAASIRDDAPQAALERAAWEERLRRATAAFRGRPLLQSGSASLRCLSGRAYFLDSDGRRSARPDQTSTLVLEASAQAPDGMPLSNRRRWVAPSCAELPASEELDAAASSLARELEALAAAPQLEAYVGPVLFEGQAAGEFFHQLLARHLCAPRGPWVEEDGVKERFRAGELTDRLGLRVISPLLDVHDDPSRRSYEGAPLAGSYAFDDEGVPPERVELIRRGVSVDLPLGRAPTKGRARSNGHGRGAASEHPTGRPGNLFIIPSRGLSAAELKAELLRQAREFGLSYALIVRRLTEESSQEEGERLSAPILLYKVHVADGREEPVRDAVFSGVTLRALRDINAVSSALTVTNVLQPGPYREVRGELPVGLVHPDVLVGEMELRRSERKPQRLPYLPRPKAAG